VAHFDTCDYITVQTRLSSYSVVVLFLSVFEREYCQHVTVNVYTLLIVSHRHRAR